MRPDFESASNFDGLKFAKGITRREKKSSEDYREAQVKKAVRAKVMKRERERCRLATAALVVGDCMGRPTWQHLFKRSESRGMDPEIRHNSETSICACERHHELMDHGAGAERIGYEYLTEKGADGRMAFLANGLRYEELEDPR